MSKQFDLISDTIDYIVRHETSQPSLSHLAKKAGYSESHFQSLFQSYVGLSPANLWRYTRYKKARDLLFEKQFSTLNSSIASGLSGQGRLHDMFVTIEAATPGEVKRKGEGMRITYGECCSVLGRLSIGCTERGVCWLGFDQVGENQARKGKSMERMKAKWPRALFNKDNQSVQHVANMINSIWSKAKPSSVHPKINLHLFGTNFQVQVWQALLKIPVGKVCSYADIATAINKQNASRAVGTAIGENPVSVLIPCHRVIQASGIVENYGWGDTRKKAVLLSERLL